MPLFKYKVLDADGKPREGTQEAKDKFALYQLLREQYGGETSFYFDMAQHLYET